MRPRWHRRLEAARAQVLSDGMEICALLESNNPHIRQAADELLISVGWRPSTFLSRYFDVLMRENRRG